MEAAPTPLKLPALSESDLEIARLRVELEAAKAALQETRARYTALVEKSPQAVYRAELDVPISVLAPVEEQVRRIFQGGYLAECNGMMAAMYGLDSTEHLVGMPIRQLLSDEDPANWELLKDFVRNDYRLSDFETRELAVDGAVRYFVNSIAGVVVDGKLAYAWGTQRDVTEQKLFERTLKHSDQRHRAWAEAAGQVFFTTDERSNPTTVSESFTELTGYPVEVCLTQPWKMLVHPEDWPALAEKWLEHFETSRAFSHQYRLVRADGGIRHVLETTVPILNEEGTAIEWVGSIADVTEKIQIEGRLRQTEKLAALGRLVAGVAHEINNPLTVLQMSAQLLQLHSDACVVDRAGTIRKMCERISRIVSSLLTFARGGSGERKLCSLNATVESAVDMVSLRLGESEATIVARYVEANPLVMVDSPQIEQVILNLVVNAEHALRDVESGDKRIEIWTETSQDGLEARIRVSDNGHGMSEEVRRRIFDPFFTTKPVGEGNGLGLSICHGIVEAHGGSIAVVSQPGEGAEFCVSLPIYWEQAA